MRKKILFSIIFLIIFLFGNNLLAYDNIDTHPRITKSAAENSKLNNYLIQNLALTDGLQTKLPANSKNSILFLLSEGSRMEDIPMCRASNHFHNPLKSWDQSFMSDDTSPLGLLVRGYCELSEWPYSERKSNVTWGTGYLSPSSSKISRANQWMGWDDARDYYYWALKATSSTERETYFAKTFQALGQGSHLLEDMAVPAHVRNDFTSHLSFIGFISENPVEWFGSLYEDYVKNNPGIVAGSKPAPITLTNPRLTDFWDTDRYVGDNPSASPLGLAEFTNANYFSDTTIINNKPSTEHYFDYPVVNSQNHQVCEDYALGKNRIRKYVSRRDRGECPPVTEERKTDHFAAISIVEADATVTNENLPFLYLWLDENVHNTYAKELVPQAISYSAALLDYFFRGNLQVTAVPIIYKGELSFMKVKIKNLTPKETMKNGELVLTYRYTPVGAPADGSGDIFGRAWNFDGSAFVPCVELKERDAMEVDFVIYPAIPEKDYDSIKFSLAFRGTLGNEEGAVIGKSFLPGTVVFSEEWDKELPGNYPWGHTGLNVFGNPDNGSTGNVIVGGTTLVKDNSRFAGKRNPRFNDSLVSNLIYNGQFRPEEGFPIPVTPNTYIMFKIDAMWINAIPNAPPGQTRQWQGLWLYFDHGLKVEFSTNDQNVVYDEKTAAYTFYFGVTMLNNIYQLFEAYGIPIPEGPFYLQGISFLQQLADLDVSDPADIEYHQHMEVDFIQIIEGKEQ